MSVNAPHKALQAWLTAVWSITHHIFIHIQLNQGRIEVTKTKQTLRIAPNQTGILLCFQLQD